MDAERPLTPKQAAFVAEYLIDLNAFAAAKRAGYKDANKGRQLVTLSNVWAAITAGMAEREKRTHITQDRVLQEIASLSFSDLRHYVLTDRGNVQLAEGAPSTAMCAVSSIKRKTKVVNEITTEYEVEIKLWDKPSSLKMAGQHLAMFTEKHEVNVKTPGVLVLGGVDIDAALGRTASEAAQENRPQ